MHTTLFLSLPNLPPSSLPSLLSHTPSYYHALLFSFLLVSIVLIMTHLLALLIGLIKKLLVLQLTQKLFFWGPNIEKQIRLIRKSVHGNVGAMK